MRHLYLFIHLVRQSQFRQGIVLDNQLPLLQPGNGLFYFLIIAPRHSKKVFYHAVGNGLLLHDERILRIGIEIKILALETVHILRGKNNAQSLVPTHGNKVAKRMVREEHVYLQSVNYLLQLCVVSFRKFLRLLHAHLQLLYLALRLGRIL